MAGEGVRLAGASEEELLNEMEEDEQRYTQPQPSLTEGDSELLSSDEEVRQKRQKLDIQKCEVKEEQKEA